jgi:hypothetical protein
VMEALRSSETSVLTRAPRRKIPEGGIVHSHCRENLKPYIIIILGCIYNTNSTHGQFVRAVRAGESVG